ncbi:hypothetical protein NEOLEDRAFT_1138998 [Neolentinus lepideus HHB14362 ss-1]|uniref:DUF6533 domain-containing protein n=1 Tax=Neolentinus lepideus HHB14362 ss-1 TaxID=1314782 RepID=A0A165Q185_9AGAM|nr:hypothetical protein NEOLEDRAFT_1138998 [Neolentinus lepideus HHB14362 ss-1]
MSASSNVTVAAHRLQVVRYTQVASMAVLIAEWFFVIGEEVEYVWKAPWTYMKVLYLLSRYTPFLDTPFNLLNYLRPRISPKACLVNYKIAATSTFVGMNISEYILIIRTHALYRRSKTMGWILGGGVVICTIVGVITLALFETSLVFGPLPSPEIPGCLLQEGSDIVFANFVILLLWELLIVILTAYKAIRDFRISNGPVLQTLYRDGIIFFFFLLTLSTANIIVFVVAPLEYLDLFDTLTRCLHSIICCRVLLNLRGAANESDSPTATPQMGASIRFVKIFTSRRSRGDLTYSTEESFPMNDMSRSAQEP